MVSSAVKLRNMVAVRIKVLPVICVVGILSFILISWMLRRVSTEDHKSLHNFRLSKAKGISSLVRSLGFSIGDGIGTSTSYGFTETPLFYKGLSGYNTTRIPALVYKDNTFIAFCEARKDTDEDIGNMDIISRRGRRVGSKVIWDMPTTVVSDIPGKRTMNPVPIIDKVRNTILFIFISINAEDNQHDIMENGTLGTDLHVTKSHDNGKTWSKPVTITESTVLKMSPVPAMFAPGPGHAVQLKSGRLLVPANIIYKDKNGAVEQHGCVGQSTVIYSDDGGDTWHNGGRVPLAKDRNGKFILTNEVQAVEFDDNVVCLNSRTLSSHHTRAITCSYDGGLTFKWPRLAHGLIEPGFKNIGGVIVSGNFSGCQGSVVGFPAPPDTDFNDDVNKTWVLFSNPADAMDRKDTSIRLSKDGMQQWSEPWTINHQAGAYSDLTYFETGHGNSKTQNFAILYEKGFRDAYESIVFRTFTLEDVIQGIL